MGNGKTHRNGSYWTLGLAFLDSGNYIAVNWSLVRKYGLNCAVIIGELASEAMRWSKEGKLDDGWFFCTIETLEYKTGLNQYYQNQALKELQESGIVSVEYKGLPRKRYFRIDMAALLNEVNDQPSTEFMTSEEQSSSLAGNHVDSIINKEYKPSKNKSDDFKGKKREYPETILCQCGGQMKRTASRQTGTGRPYYRCDSCGTERLYR